MKMPKPTDGDLARFRSLAPDEAAAELSALAGSGPFGPEGRPMGGYLSLPPDLDDAEASAWLERAREHVATFPPKRKKR